MRTSIAFLLLSLVGDLSNQDRVFLNHIYLTIDRASLTELKHSDFVSSQLFAVRQATIHADSGSAWTALYLFGRHTYLEIYEQALPSKPIAIAFGVDTVGLMDGMAGQLAKDFDVTDKVRTRTIRNNEVRWFRSIEINSSPGDDFRTWIMQYEPSYMDSIVAPALKVTSSGRVDRAMYNARVFDEEKLVNDITEVSLRLQKANAQQFDKLMKYWGYSHENKENSTMYYGPGIAFRIEASTVNEILYIRFELTREYCGEDLRVGSTRFEFLCGEKAAVWTL